MHLRFVISHVRITQLSSMFITQSADTWFWFLKREGSSDNVLEIANLDSQIYARLESGSIFSTYDFGSNSTFVMILRHDDVFTVLQQHKNAYANFFLKRQERTGAFIFQVLVSPADIIGTEEVSSIVARYEFPVTIKKGRTESVTDLEARLQTLIHRCTMYSNEAAVVNRDASMRNSNTADNLPDSTTSHTSSGSTSDEPGTRQRLWDDFVVSTRNPFMLRFFELFKAIDDDILVLKLQSKTLPGNEGLSKTLLASCGSLASEVAFTIPTAQDGDSSVEKQNMVAQRSKKTILTRVDKKNFSDKFRALFRIASGLSYHWTYIVTLSKRQAVLTLCHLETDEVYQTSLETVAV